MEWNGSTMKTKRKERNKQERDFIVFRGPKGEKRIL